MSVGGGAEASGTASDDGLPASAKQSALPAVLLMLMLML